MVKLRINKARAVDLLTLVVAVATSSAITWAVAEEKLGKQMRQQVKEVKDYYKKKSEMDKLREDLLEKKYEPAEEAEEVELPTPVQLDEAPDPEDRLFVKETLEVYGAKQFTGGEAAAQRPLHPKSRPNVQVITRDEFDDDDEEYPNQEKVAGIYYRQDDVFVDQFEDVVANYRTVVGDLKREFQDKEDGATIHIRNVVLKLDYEIDLDEGSYSESVLGFEPDPPDARVPTRLRDRG